MCEKKNANEMNLHQKFSILLYVNQAKQNKKGLVPIWARLTIDSLRAPFSTGKYITADSWESGNQRVRPQCPEAKAINSHLQLMATELHRHVCHDSITNERCANGDCHGTVGSYRHPDNADLWKDYTEEAW